MIAFRIFPQMKNINKPLCRDKAKPHNNFIIKVPINKKKNGLTLQKQLKMLDNHKD